MDAPSYVNPDGSFVSDWASKLPEEEFGDFRSTLARYKNPVEVARALKHANVLVGKKGVIPPTADSTPEQIADYRKAMGVPETAQAYAEAVKPKVEVPPDVQWSDEISGQYFEIAHKHNIPPAAMQELAQMNVKQREFEVKAAMAQINERKQNHLQTLRQTWGANFERNMDVVKRAAHRYEVDPNDPGWASPAIVRMVARMAGEMGEDKFVAAGASLPAGAADFKSRAKDIQTNPQNPNYQKYWNGDADVQRMVRDYLKKSGG